MANKLNLSKEEILEKKFSKEKLGYNPLEVDEFLDRIMMDYQTFDISVVLDKESYIALMDKITRLEKEKSDIEIEKAKLENRFANIKSTDQVTSDNLNLMKKINVYERFLWSHGFDPNKID